MKERLLFFFVLLATGFGWGVTQVLGKWAVSSGHQAFGLIFWQFLIGFLLLGGLTVVQGRGVVLTSAALRFAVIIALIGTLIPNASFYYSIARLPAGIMSIIISAVPLLSFPIALALGHDRFSALRLAGLLTGLAGVALIAFPQSSLPSPAMAAFIPIAMIGPLFYAIEANYVASAGTAGMRAVQAMALASLAGAILALPMALVTGQWVNPFISFGLPEVSLVAMGIIHALAYSAYVWLAGRAGAVYAAQCAYVVTGSGVVWAMLLLGERYSGWVWAALACMMVGLTLVQPKAREILAPGTLPVKTAANATSQRAR